MPPPKRITYQTAYAKRKRLGNVTKTEQSAAPGSAQSSHNIAGGLEKSATEILTKGATVNVYADEVDMQKSDSDEDGYSNIDFYEDDYQLIESEESIDEYDPAWAQTFQPPCEVFNYDGKLQQSLRGLKSEVPISYFDLILGPRAEFFTKLANSCSTRAANTMETPSNFHSFTSEDLQIFMGLCLQMSSIRLFELDQYWNENAHFGFGGFGDKMRINRFKMILRVLNFDMFKHTESSVTSSNDKLSDKFSEVRSLLDYFNSRMESVYICDRRLVLNEPLLYWKGKFDWLNEVKTKFRCNAVMLHFLTEPSGLLLRIVPDLEELERKQLTRNSKSLAVQRLTIAMEVLKPKLRKGHCVYTSKFYGSYALALELAKRQTYSSGFLDCNRFGNSKELLLTSLSKGCAVARYADDIMMAKYRHREKSFYFYSSNGSTISTAKSSPGNVVKELEMLLCLPPDIRSKMLNCQIVLPRAEIQWDKRLMIYVMNLFVLNAYILYTKNAILRKDEPPIRYEKFRQEVVTSLLSTNLENKHIIQIIPAIDDKVVKKRCQICRKGGLMTYSKYSCKMCPGMPGLCESPCFKIWHDQLDKSTLAITIGAAVK